MDHIETGGGVEGSTVRNLSGGQTVTALLLSQIRNLSRGQTVTALLLSQMITTTLALA